MTTITAHRVASPRAVVRTTAFDRALLQAASALDAFVVARLERRASVGRRRAIVAQDAAATTRGAAEARGALGLLPR
ncbi:hypothetical protein IF188_07100 [Microbacterium sp. NEAU-LLC]|uniref:Uncharacterized protein n=1 Tax=Microbacterium helvum TaxID=2773713 RepID=A0ABR8NLB7_9MICO|nr:hypothetical protein [Microbacterium helvum]MBD3941463.1 hypothetical protein [Microbacterium helvum]